MDYASGPKVREAMSTPLAKPTGSGLDNLTSPASLATFGAAGVNAMSGRPMPTSYEPTPIRSAIRGAGTIMENAPGAGGVARVVGRLMQKMPVPQTFQDQPLYKQMEQLPPTDSAPMPTTVTIKPAAGKMDAVRRNGPTALNPPMPMRGRLAMPPYQEQPTAPSPLSASDVASLVKQGYTPEMIAKLAATMAGK